MGHIDGVVIQDSNTVQDIELIGQRRTPTSISQYHHDFNTNVPGKVNNPGIKSLDNYLVFDGDTLVLSVGLLLEQQRIEWLM